MMLILLIPSFFLITIVFLFPLIEYLFTSLNAVSVATGFNYYDNNGANWIRLLNDDRFWIDTFQTIRFSLVSVSLEIILAIIVANIINQKFKGRSITRVISLLPWALPTTLMAICWRWIFNTPYGPLNQILKHMNGIQVNFLSDPQITWISTVIADIWKTTPFVALILLAGMQTIPSDLYAALKLEGGNSNEAFRKITIPMLEPYLIVSALLRLAQAFGVFELIQVMTGGGPAGSTETLALYAYLNTMRYLDFGYGATIILACFVELILLSITIVMAIKAINRILLVYT